MHYFSFIKDWFQALQTPRQWFFLGSLVVMIFLTSLGIYWVLSPAYGVLFNHLDAEDASHIIAKLDAMQTPYQVRNQGRDILIDQHAVDKTRIQLIGSDLQLAGTVGFELFDKNDFGMTDFSQKINYQRALQGELERTIHSLDEVQQVRVHLVMPERHLFEQQENLPHAAVTLHLKSRLSTQQVKSIQQLIAASVPQLPAPNVVIVDQNGNNLITAEEDASLGHFSEKKKIEQYFNEKVQHMLQHIFTHHNVMVKIDVTLNYDQLQRELEKPQQDGSIVHEKETQHSTGNKIGKTPADQDFTREKSYQFGHEKEHFTRANGTIERLTVSVVLPKNTPNAHIAQVERLVKSIIGFQEKRGDTISVEALLVASKPIPLAAARKTLSTSPTHVPWFNIIAGLVICGLTGLYLHFKARARRRALLLQALHQWLIAHQ